MRINLKLTDLDNTLAASISLHELLQLAHAYGDKDCMIQAGKNVAVWVELDGNEAQQVKKGAYEILIAEETKNVLLAKN